MPHTIPNRVIPFPKARRAPRRASRAAAQPIHLRGALRTVAEQLPEFGRRQFGIDLGPVGSLAPAHPHLHAIVNESTGLPVGVVSPDYALIQHADALHAVADGITRLGIPASACEATVELTPQGEQMLARITVAGLHRAQPADGHPLLPCALVSNSVDGKSALRAHLGWFRLISMSGLVVPHGGARLRRRRELGLSFAALAETVTRELGRAESMRPALEHLSRTPVPEAALAEWCDGVVREHWGALAAMRAFQVASRGMDVVAADPFETAPPSRRRVEDFAPVPGAAAPGAGTAHDALHALTWVASRTPNLQQRWERESQALALLARLPG